MKKSGTTSAKRAPHFAPHAASRKPDPGMPTGNAGLGKALGLTNNPGSGFTVLADEGTTSSLDGFLTPMQKGLAKRDEGRMALGELSTVTKQIKQAWAPAVHGRKEKRGGLLNSNAKKPIPFKIWTDSEEEETINSSLKEEVEVPRSSQYGEASTSLAAEVCKFETEASASSGTEDYPEPEQMQAHPSADLIDYYSSEPPEETQYLSADVITLEFTLTSLDIAQDILDFEEAMQAAADAEDADQE